MSTLIETSTNIFRCPITRKIFLNSVIASDDVFMKN